MKAPHQGESVDSAVSQVPQKVGAVPGLKTKIMAALAAVGLAASAEKVEGAIILVPTVPTPGWTTTGSGANNVSRENSTTAWRSYISTGYNTDGTFSSTFQVAMNAVDVGQYGWTLTISGHYRVIATIAKPSTAYDVDAKFFLSVNGGPTVDIATVGTSGWPITTNNIISSLDTSDGETPINTSQYFSQSIVLDPGQKTIVFTNEANSQFVWGNFYLAWDNVTYGSGINISYEKSLVPEPSTALLAGGALAAGLLRRRRSNDTKQV